MTLAPGRLVSALLVLAWSAGIYAALTTTRLGSGSWFPGSRYVFNLGHAGLFAVEALLLGALLRPGPVARPPGPWLLAAWLALAYSGVLELVQAGIPGRHGSWADMLSNAVGAFGAPWALAAEGPTARRLGLVAVAALLAAAVATAGDH